VIGTVKGDLHDIGKNLVASMLEGGGFEVIDLGADVAPELFIEAVSARHANLVALSALLTVTMGSMKTTIDAFQAAGLRDKVKIMVGGAPVTQQYADAIGADGYSDSAAAAVALARKLVVV
jgi:5-methyltetrahydrofolate--homocysteine methyltransferase